ncbi:hypothetical protein JFN94_25985 [Burkholderia anthina]|uniref:Uncharacterized protein n=1 Tax=Burkholderia anthina TaxID=179879 RepID=A0A7T7AJM1_9BURK|nr:hypothetical protein [Burkholderia anthina]QQK04782.1 hypothetical protein JFN94_25985 [Burkholderia anthina]
MKNPNTGHGHVFPRADGMKARCGAPGLCAACAADLARQKGFSGDAASTTPARAHLPVDGTARLDELERQAIDLLRDIQERYLLEAEPIVQHLANIRAMRPPRPIFVCAEALANLPPEKQEGAC